MQCSEFQDRFHTLLDQRLSLEEDASLTQHAASCASCRADLASWESLSSGLELWEPPRSTVAIESIVAAALRETLAVEPSAAPAPAAAPKRRFDFSSFIAPVLLSAAVLAVAALLPTFLTNPTGNALVETQPATAPNEPAPALPENFVADTPTPRNVGADADEQRRELLDEMRRQLPGAPSLESISSDLSLPTGLRPIAGSFEIAIDAFRKAIPGNNSAHNAPTKPQASNVQPANFA